MIKEIEWNNDDKEMLEDIIHDMKQNVVYPDQITWLENLLKKLK